SPTRSSSSSPCGPSPSKFGSSSSKASSAGPRHSPRRTRRPRPRSNVEEFNPATINSPELVERVVPFLTKALGVEHVKPTDPVMGAEDFALYAEGNVPIMMFWLGTMSPERIAAAKARGNDLPTLHSGLFYPDTAPTIATGIKAMTAAVVGLLPPRP